MNQIPEKKPSKGQRKERKFLTMLPCINYLDLEKESMERGVSVLELSSAIILNWMIQEGYHPSSSLSVAGDKQTETEQCQGQK